MRLLGCTEGPWVQAGKAFPFTLVEEGVFCFCFFPAWALYIQLVGSRSAVGVLRGESEGERGERGVSAGCRGSREGPRAQGQSREGLLCSFLLTLLPLSPWSRRLFGSRREEARSSEPQHAASGVTVLFRVREPLRTALRAQTRPWTVLGLRPRVASQGIRGSHADGELN